MQNRIESMVNAIATQGYHLIDDFLEEQDYLALLNQAKELNQQGLFQQAKIGSQINTTLNEQIRSDAIYWLDEAPLSSAINRYMQAIQTLANSLNQSLYLGLFDFETHFAVYQPGAFYKKHVDQFATKKTRRISCVYYLNPDWDQTMGGELRLYDKEDQVLATVLPEGNRLICFSSELPHEVCKTRATRYSITGWLKTRN